MDFSKLRKLGKDEIGELFLNFRRGDGADTGYILTADNAEVWVNEATVVEFIKIDGATSLAGFVHSETYTPNLGDIIDIPENPDPLPERPSDMVQLMIEGIDPNHPHKKIADIAGVFIADREMQNQDPAKQQFQICTHSISQGQGLLVLNSRGKVDYTITDDDGKVWVKVEQTGTTLQGQFGGEFPNNHPRKADIAGLKEDCVVFVPLRDASNPDKLRNYKIDMKNTGDLSIEFWLIFPWSPDGNERRIHLSTVEPKSSSSFYLNASDLGLDKMADYERAIKINFNTVPVK